VTLAYQEIVKKIENERKNVEWNKDTVSSRTSRGHVNPYEGEI